MEEIGISGGELIKRPGKNAGCCTTEDKELLA
jgi:hypothetical protein